jgi:hypothetical protein
VTLRQTASGKDSLALIDPPVSKVGDPQIVHQCKRARKSILCVRVLPPVTLCTGLRGASDKIQGDRKMDTDQYCGSRLPVHWCFISVLAGFYEQAVEETLRLALIGSGDQHCLKRSWVLCRSLLKTFLQVHSVVVLRSSPAHENLIALVKQPCMCCGRCIIQTWSPT